MKSAPRLQPAAQMVLSGPSPRLMLAPSWVLQGCPPPPSRSLCQRVHLQLQFLKFLVILPFYMTTGKTIALTKRTFVGKVMSLLLNMLSRLVITFLPRRKRIYYCGQESLRRNGVTIMVNKRVQNAVKESESEVVSDSLRPGDCSTPGCYIVSSI